MDLTNPVICLKCGGGIAIRISRNGFWQRNVLSRIGYYPWKCGACGRIFLYRRRHEKTRSSKRGAESAASGHNQSRQT